MDHHLNTLHIDQPDNFVSDRHSQIGDNTVNGELNESCLTFLSCIYDCTYNVG